MESRSGIIAVLLLVLGGCSGEGSDSLFGSPGDSGAAGDDSGNGGTNAVGGKAGSGAGRAGSSGSSAGTGQAGRGGGSGGSGKGGAGSAGTGAGGSAQGGEESGDAGSDSGGSGAGGSGTSGSGATGAGGSDTAGAGGSNPTGGRGGMAGTGGKVSCEELNASYAELLEKAKACDANLDEDQCREQVPSDLGCGCPTSVNPKNEEVMAELHGILLQASKSCPVVICPAIACIPTQGFCTSSGRGSGRCDDGLLAE